MAALRITRRREWILDIEWDRKIYTGNYSRHATEDEAREHLRKVIASDPPARWRIVAVREVRAVLDESGSGWDAEELDNPPTTPPAKAIT